MIKKQSKKEIFINIKKGIKRSSKYLLECGERYNEGKPGDKDKPKQKRDPKQLEEDIMGCM